MTVGAVLALIDVTISRLPEARYAIEVLAEARGWVVDHIASAEVVSPRI